MKILYIIDSLSSGGAEKLVRDTVPLINQNKDVKVVVLLLTDENNVYENHLREQGIEIKIITLRKIRSPLNIFYILKYIKENNYDVVHVHLFPANYWTSIASKLIINNKPKFILTEHSTHNKRREKWYFRYIEKFVYSSFDKVISISPSTQYNLLKWLRFKNEKKRKFSIIGNGIDLNCFSQATPYKKYWIDNGLRETDKLIGMVGRFSDQKDQATVIKALINLPKDIKLLLIGEGKLKKEIEKLAVNLGVAKRVYFLGFRNDVNRILKTADIIVLSSFWEGFGLAAVEGMAAGKPVVASDVPGLSEVVQGAGCLFSQGNYNELSSIVEELFNNNTLYEKVKKNCLKRSVEYNINSMVKDYLKEYKDLLQ